MDASSESLATPHPLFSYALNGMKSGGLSIIQSVNQRLKYTFAKHFLHNSLMQLYINCPRC